MTKKLSAVRAHEDALTQVAQSNGEEEGADLGRVRDSVRCADSVRQRHGEYCASILSEERLVHVQITTPTVVGEQNERARECLRILQQVSTSASSGTYNREQAWALEHTKAAQRVQHLEAPRARINAAPARTDRLRKEYSHEHEHGASGYRNRGLRGTPRAPMCERTTQKRRGGGAELARLSRMRASVRHMQRVRWENAPRTLMNHPIAVPRSARANTSAMTAGPTISLAAPSACTPRATNSAGAFGASVARTDPATRMESAVMYIGRRPSMLMGE
jgi:hypothetical protein